MKIINDTQKSILLEEFRRMKTVDDLAFWLNHVVAVLYEQEQKLISIKLLKALAYSQRMHTYKQFEIPKKNGGSRVICAPIRTLKRVQRCLNVAFQWIYEPNEAAMGFVPGRCVADNARRHTGKNFVYNIDLCDFFTSISEGRVYMLLKSKSIGLPCEVASLIARLCCRWIEVENDEKKTRRGVLPQGAPTSPILTNLVCQRLDRRLYGLARRFKMDYSRYADDITFSSNRNHFHESGKFVTELRRLITEESFTINETKVRLQKKAYRQEVTGLIVNEKPNVTKHYIQDIRLGLYYWEHYGEERAGNIFAEYRHKRGNLQNILMGKLLYMKMVKGEADPTYQKLAARYAALAPSEKSHKKSEETTDLFAQLLVSLQNKGLEEVVSTL